MFVSDFVSDPTPITISCNSVCSIVMPYQCAERESEREGERERERERE